MNKETKLRARLTLADAKETLPNEVRIRYRKQLNNPDGTTTEQELVAEGVIVAETAEHIDLHRTDDKTDDHKLRIQRSVIISIDPSGEIEVLNALLLNVESESDDEQWGNVYLDNVLAALPAGYSTTKFTDYLGSLEKRGLYHPRHGDDVGTWGQVKLAE